MWSRAKWENKCVGESKSRKDIDKIGGNICEETQVSDTPGCRKLKKKKKKKSCKGWTINLSTESVLKTLISRSSK